MWYSNVMLGGIAWAAGLFEGEGCICINAEGYVILALVMADEDVVRRFAAEVGAGKVSGPIKRGREHWKPMWRWLTTNRAEIEAVLHELRPYLGDRRAEKANQAIIRLLEQESAHEFKRLHRSPGAIRAARYRARRAERSLQVST
jgi:hypothetical protein